MDDEDVNQLIEHHQFEKDLDDKDDIIESSDNDDKDDVECDEYHDEKLDRSDDSDEVEKLAEDLSLKLPSESCDKNIVNIEDRLDAESILQENVEPLSVSNSQYRPFRDSKSTQPAFDARSVSIASSSVSQIEIKQRVKRQISKQQRAYNNRRLKKGEASLVNKRKNELRRDVEESKDFYLM